MQRKPTFCLVAKIFVPRFAVCDKHSANYLIYYVIGAAPLSDDIKFVNVSVENVPFRPHTRTAYANVTFTPGTMKVELC